MFVIVRSYSRICDVRNRSFVFVMFVIVRSYSRIPSIALSHRIIIIDRISHHASLIALVIASSMPSHRIIIIDRILYRTRLYQLSHSSVALVIVSTIALVCRTCHRINYRTRHRIASSIASHHHHRSHRITSSLPSHHRLHRIIIINRIAGANDATREW